MYFSFLHVVVTLSGNLHVSGLHSNIFPLVRFVSLYMKGESRLNLIHRGSVEKSIHYINIADTLLVVDLDLSLRLASPHLIKKAVSRGDLEIILKNRFIIIF